MGILSLLRRQHVRSEQDPSQHGEATRLRKYIRRSDPHFLVEVGAHDGSYLSNSLLFLREGWGGILIEPHPGLFLRLSALHTENPRVRCVQKACADRAGTMPLYLGKNDNLAVSTLCTDDNQWFDMHRSADSLEVEVDLLTTILEEHACPSSFGMLLVDAEAMDKEVLDGLDFDRFRPRIVLTEDYFSDMPKHLEKERKLEERGYTKKEHIGCNVLWVDASRP